MTRIARAFRAFTRELSRRNAGFDAAGGGRRWQGAPIITAPNTQGLAAAGAMLPRVRYAYENNPIARNAVDMLLAISLPPSAKEWDEAAHVSWADEVAGVAPAAAPAPAPAISSSVARRLKRA
jgi:hypothetical protein